MLKQVILSHIGILAKLYNILIELSPRILMSSKWFTYLPTTLKFFSGHGANFPGFSRFFRDA